MKRLIICAAALGLMVSLPALAQNNDHRGGKKDAPVSQSDRGGHANGNVQQRDVRSNKGTAHQDTFAPQQGANKGQSWGTPRTMNTQPKGRMPATNARKNQYLPDSGDVRGAASNRSMANGNQRNPGWSGDNAKQRPEFNAFRRNMQSPQHFRSGRYNAPRGYQQRHWGYGERLPSEYFVRDYWISNFLMFGLFAPPSDLIWVRVGDDALLIDRYSGEIVQVRYGVFY
jgi:Ni/Co efflux regulator RcnB